VGDPVPHRAHDRPDVPWPVDNSLKSGRERVNTLADAAAQLRSQLPVSDFAEPVGQLMATQGVKPLLDEVDVFLPEALGFSQAADHGLPLALILPAGHRPVAVLGDVKSLQRGQQRQEAGPGTHRATQSHGQVIEECPVSGLESCPAVKKIR
jgi:hypothetical protein